MREKRKRGTSEMGVVGEVAALSRVRREIICMREIELTPFRGMCQLGEEDTIGHLPSGC